MNSIKKVLIACSAVCAGLYLGVAQFLGSTKELNDSLDVRSLAHVRPEIKEEKTAEPELQPVAVSEDLPERDSDERLDVSSEEASASGEANGRLVTPTDAAAAQLRKTLGVNEPQPAVPAVMVTFQPPSGCASSRLTATNVAVQYRHASPTIKGDSMRNLEMLIAGYHECDGGVFSFSHNPLGQSDGTPMRKQRRLDELKYFFVQNSVPKMALRFPTTYD